MPAGYSFRPRLWALALAAAGCAAGIALGNWQTERAAQKRAAGAAIELVTLRGQFDPRYTVYLDNKIHRGRPGYYIVQPLRLDGARHVLVNRGWAPAGPTREQLPEIRTPAGIIELSGPRLTRFARSYEPAPGKPEGKVWQNVTREQFSAWSGLALEPYNVEQHSAADDGLARDWPRAESGAERNDAYALQWYALSALSIVLLLALNIKIGKRNS